MDDYISRETAMRAIIDKQRDHTTPSRLTYELGKKHAADEYVDVLKSIPAADVRPVVLCRNCKWWTKQEASLQGRCALFGIYPTGAWYCANGTICKADMREETND